MSLVIVLSATPAASLAFFFFFNDTATTEIYTLSLHDALPISDDRAAAGAAPLFELARGWRQVGIAGIGGAREVRLEDRKSTRLNSSHQIISYAVFCLKKKKKKRRHYCLGWPPAHSPVGARWVI